MEISLPKEFLADEKSMMKISMRTWLTSRSYSMTNVREILAQNRYLQKVSVQS